VVCLGGVYPESACPEFIEGVKGGLSANDPKVKDESNSCKKPIRKTMFNPFKKIGMVGGFIVFVCTVFTVVMGYFTTRPNVFVEGRVIDRKVQLVLKNSGITTAYKTTLDNPFVYAGEYPPKIGAMPIAANQPQDLASGQEFTFEHAIQPPSQRDLVQKRAAVYANGSVTYSDWLGIPHETPFNLIYGGPYDIATGWMGSRK